LDAVAEGAPDFAPASLLDFGAGPGTASWAALQIWPSLRSITMLDRNTALLACAKELARAGTSAALRDAKIQQGAMVSPDSVYDVVLAGYVFAELPSAEIEETARRLWNACRGVLVIVEPGTPDGFERIRAIRETLLSDRAAIAAPCPGSYACPIAGSD
jgi:ribosomal protein RSM22 (predicted rRNA methylase)